MTADQLAKLLDELGTRLGPTGAHVFDLAVRQQLIEGVMTGAMGLIFTTITVTGLLIIRAGWRRDHKELGSGDGYFIMGVIVAGIAGLFAILSFSYAVPLILNPEWAALQDILRAVKP